MSSDKTLKLLAFIFSAATVGMSIYAIATSSNAGGCIVLMIFALIFQNAYRAKTKNSFIGK